MNSTRWALYERLKATGLPLETGTGGRTKYNWAVRQIPKTHWLDAANVGASTPTVLHGQGRQPWLIAAKGRQKQQMTNVDRYGFPVGHAKGASRVQGFTTGDMVRAVVPTGKYAGTYVGRVGIKSNGHFKIRGGFGMVENIPARYCQPLHRNDGYGYAYGKEAALPPQA